MDVSVQLAVGKIGGGAMWGGAFVSHLGAPRQVAAFAASHASPPRPLRRASTTEYTQITWNLTAKMQS